MKTRTYTLITAALSLAAATAFGQATDAGTLDPNTPKWDTSAQVGLSLTRGNSKTLLVNGNIQSARKWGKNELNLGADATYGENDDVKNADSERGYAQYNRLFTERAFGYLRFEALHDGIADIDYRLTFSPGAGYYLIKTTNTTLRVEIGPGYVYEKLAGKTDDFFTLRIAERFDQRLSERAKLWEAVEFLPQVDDWNNYIINGEIGIETAITKKFKQRTYVQDTYNSQPAPHRQKNDIKLIAAVAYTF